MFTVQPYLNFDGKAEEAFNFYKSVFGGEFSMIQRFNEVPASPDMPPIPEEEGKRIMHVALPIGNGGMLMASDTMPSMGHKLTEGNNFYVSLHPDNKEEADQLFKALSEGGAVEMPMMDMFWGAYYGAFKDKFGIQWMINCVEAK